MRNAENFPFSNYGRTDVKRVENNTILMYFDSLTVSALFGVFSLIKFLMYTFFPCAYASIEFKIVLNSYVIELIVATNIKEELPEKVALFALHVVIRI